MSAKPLLSGVFAVSILALCSSILAQSGPRAVKVMRPMRADVDRTIELPADVMAYRETMVKARTSGYLKEVLLDRGDRVKAGQTLAVIDRPEDKPMRRVMEREREVALQEIQLAHAAVAVAMSRVTAAGSGLDAARAEVEAKKVALELLEKNLVRYRSLKAEGSATAQQLDEAEAAVRQGHAAHVTQKAQLLVIEASIAEAKAMQTKADGGVLLARAHAEAAKARLELFQRRTELKVVRAPFDAIVVKRMVHEGALALGGDGNSNPTTLFHLISSDALRVVIPIPESEIRFVKKGSKVEIRGSGIHGEALLATVQRVSALLDMKNRSLPVEVLSDDPRLVAGMGVYALITLETKTSVMTVPSEALSFRKKKAWLWAAVDGKAKKLPVKVGYNDLIRAEVLDLNPDTQVIVNSAGLSEGAPVRVVSTDGEAK